VAKLSVVKLSMAGEVKQGKLRQDKGKLSVVKLSMAGEVKQGKLRQAVEGRHGFILFVVVISSTLIQDGTHALWRKGHFQVGFALQEISSFLVEDHCHSG
jgi:hypothetical protein